MKSADHMIYNKIPIFRGNLIGCGIKRFSRSGATTNDQLPTVGATLATLGTHCLTAAHFDTSFVDPLRFHLFLANLSLEILKHHSPTLGGPLLRYVRYVRY